jgi:hypothetical protein
MSESSPPDSASTNPATTTAAAPAPTTTKTVSMVERVGTSLTIPAVLAGVAVLGTILFQEIAGSIKLESINDVSNILVAGGLLSGAAVVLGAVATGLNIPALRVPTLGRGASTFFSGATLITMGIFFFVTLLPRASAVLNLQSTLAPFATSVRDNCQTPLDNETARYKQVAQDAHAVPSSPTPATISVFGVAMGNDVTALKQDVTTLSTALANLQKLKTPESKYDALLKGCITDVQGTIAFLNDATNSSAIPTAQFVQGLQQGVQGIPASIIPDAVKPAIIATIGAPGNFPTTYSAEGLLAAAAQFVTQNPTPPSITIPAPIAAALTPADQATLISLVILVGEAGFPVYVATVMDAAAANKDPQLTSEGDQLKQDIKDILTNNLSPIKVDVNKIVGS